MYKVNQLQCHVTMKIFATSPATIINTGIGILALVAFTSEARLPPKFVKATNGVGKALYASRYGYSTVPLPANIVLQTNLARKEVHHAGTPRGRRPSSPGKRYVTRRRPIYASKYQDFAPSVRVHKKRPRGSRPLKRRPYQLSRPPYKEPEYYEDHDELNEEVDDEEYEYEGKGAKYKDNEEYEDYVGAHGSKSHAKGRQKSSRNKKNKKNLDDEEEEGAYSEHPAPSYARKPKASTRPTSSRPSSKLYSSSTLGLPARAPRVKQDERHVYEDDSGRRHRSKEKSKKSRIKDGYRLRDPEDEEHSSRPRYRKHFDDEHLDEEAKKDRGHKHRESKDKRTSRLRYHENEHDYGNTWDDGEDERYVRSSRERENLWKSRESEEFTANKFQKLLGETWKDEQMRKWLEEYEAKEKQEENKNKNYFNDAIKPQLSTQPWASQFPAEVPPWKETPFHMLPSIAPILQTTEQTTTWNNEFSNQQNWNKPEQNNKWPDEPLNWSDGRGATGDTSFGNSWRSKLATTLHDKKEQLPKVNNGMTVALASLEWKPEDVREGEITDHQKWKNQNYQERNPLQQPPSYQQPTSQSQNARAKWPSVNISPPSPTPPSSGEVVYGNRIKDANSRRKEPDIGFGQGMEVVDHLGGSFVL